MDNKNRYNKYGNIEIKSFYDEDDVSELIGDKLIELNDNDASLVVYGKRDFVTALFLNMISNGYDFGYIDLDKVDDLKKGKIYLVTVTGDCTINIEPAYSDERKITGHDADIAIIFADDCTQDIVDYCVDNDTKVILFDFEDDEGFCNEENNEGTFEDCENCDGCCNYNGCKDCGNRNGRESYKENLNTYESKSTTVTVSKTKNDVPKGFTKSWFTDENGVFSHSTYSFYSGDFELLRGVAKEFGVKL